MKLLDFFLFAVILALFSIQNLSAQMTTFFEKDNNYTPTYYEVIEFYNALASQHEIATIKPFGNTDSGFPLHELIIDLDGSFQPSDSKTILFINNAIHPGEPCGIDASMLLIRDICEGKIPNKVLKDIQIVMVPFYNIGGGLNRGSHSRANQVGPKEYGFRGNAKNLDLNRDFIKCDSENAKSFNLLFNKWNPHVMIDNHTSNGADYQYTMTLIATQKDKLASELSVLMTDRMLPFLYDEMQKVDYEMTPYVYSYGPPDEGIIDFMDLPRYSSGYAALHNTISFMPETHMLKPYKDRVLSTYEFMRSMLLYLEKDGQQVKKCKEDAIQSLRTSEEITVDWRLDKENSDSLIFKGYEAKYKESDVSGKKRLYYDRSQPYEKVIPYYNKYVSKEDVSIPEAYIIPQAYRTVVERLLWNNVQVDTLDEEAIFEVEIDYIEDFNTTESPYEGHYLHSNVITRKEKIEMLFYKGDYIVKTNQREINYIVSVLEPTAPDSFFAWNFFDGILMQKEHFSDYVFEDLAHQIINEDEELKKAFEKKKSDDLEFNEDGSAQLDYIYHHSHHYEQTHNRYPIGRILK